MNRPLTAAIGIVLLTLTALAGFWIGRQQQPSTTVAADDNANAAEPTVLYWYDPMVPDQRFDKPGKSPFMDMQLVPKYADEGSANGSSDGIRIDPRLVQNLGVRSVSLKHGMLSQAIHAVGSVTFNADLMQRVTAPVDGIVQRVDRRSDLLPVSRGERLARLLAPEWATAQAEYLSLLSNAGQPSGTPNPALQSLQQAGRSRLTLLGMPEAVIRQLEVQRRITDGIWLQAPIDGVIASVDVAEGDTLRRGDTLFSIAGLDSVWIDAEVDGADAQQLAMDATATVQSADLPGQTFEGHVVALLPAVDATTRRRRLRIAVPNPDHVLVPGMYVSVDAQPSGMQHGLLLPIEALIATGSRRAVVVRDGDDHFRVVDVETAASDDRHVLVTAGLSAGDEVVVSGQFLIDSEASLRQQGTRFTDDSEATNADDDDAGDMHDMHDMDAMDHGAMNHEHAMPPPAPSGVVDPDDSP